jgi:hypothetical protein
VHHNLNSQGIHYCPYRIFLHLSMGTTSQWQKFPKLGQFSFMKLWEFMNPKINKNTRCKCTILHILLRVLKGFVNIQSNFILPFQCFSLTLKHVHLHMHERLMFAMSWRLPLTCLLIWTLALIMNLRQGHNIKFMSFIIVKKSCFFQKMK